MEKKNNFEIMIIVFLLLFSFIMYGLYLVIEKYYEKYTCFVVIGVTGMYMGTIILS